MGTALRDSGPQEFSHLHVIALDFQIDA